MALGHLLPVFLHPNASLNLKKNTPEELWQKLPLGRVSLLLKYPLITFFERQSTLGRFNTSLK